MDPSFCFYGAQELEPSSENDSSRRSLLKMHSDAGGKTFVSSIGGLERPRVPSARRRLDRRLVEEAGGADAGRAHTDVRFVREMNSELWSG